MNAGRWSALVDPPWALEPWRALARQAWQGAIAPHDIDWREPGQALLFAAPALDGATPVRPVAGVPRAFLELASTVLCHHAPERLALLYELLWRILSGERDILANPADALVIQAHRLAQEVRRDAHKMKAFVRFREVATGSDEFVAWFEPGHRIVDRVAPFFARRFAGMRWSILTPYRSVRWDGDALAYGDGALASDAPGEDAHEDLWRAYYANIFNPARLNTRMMRQEMPTRYWKHLPEAQLLPTLVRDAGSRVREMAERAPEPPRRRIPRAAPADVAATGEPADLDALRRAAADCRACPLWADATQVVHGDGPPDARLVLVGEQPGDMEDLSGRPFVGPAGQLLRRALAQAGIDPGRAYMTNAVKHFRHERSGKLRLHKRPAQSHVDACQGWLRRELALLAPAVLVCLGATATQAVLGRGHAFKDARGRWFTDGSGTRPAVLATVHPAWVLRQADGGLQEQAYQVLLNDLLRVRERLEAQAQPAPAS